MGCTMTQPQREAVCQFLTKVKNRITICPRNPTARCSPERMETGFRPGICSPVLIVSIVDSGKGSNIYQSVDGDAKRGLCDMFGPLVPLRWNTTGWAAQKQRGCISHEFRS